MTVTNSEYAQAQAELNVEQWVHIRIGKRTPKKLDVEYLYEYDLPRSLWERREWVINWRVAWFQCQFPRHYISAVMAFYDKNSKKKFGGGLGAIISTKAQITKISNRLAEYKRNYIPTVFEPNAEDTGAYQSAMAKLHERECQLQQLLAEVQP